MKISLAIPVWNDLAGLDRLLKQVAKMGLFSEIIIADDGSSEPPSPDNLPAAAALAGNIVWLRSEIQLGAGHARNMALDQVSGDHVIFFDSDDLFARDFPQIVEYATESGDFDFLIFRHDDNRMLEAGGHGTFAGQEAYWSAAGVVAQPGLLSPSQAATLCQLSAYPWNKLYRTNFLRERRIRCTETMVHNDVELHWSSFIAADRILASRLTGAAHFVVEGADRLTNRRSAVRLDVICAFERVLNRLAEQSDPGRLIFLEPFVRFAWDLLSWVRRNIEDEYCPELRKRAQRLFLDHLDLRLMTLIAYGDPALGSRINQLILNGVLP